MKRSVAFLLALAVAAPAVAARPIDSLRDEARALVLVQAVLGWYTRTVGEPSIQAETYKGHDALFSIASVRAVADAAAKEKDPARKRALGFFRSYLATEFLGHELAKFDDENENAQLAATVVLPFEKSPVPYKQLAVLAANEKDAQRRAAIERAAASVWRDKLNPILERKEAEAQRLARALGYKSYVALAEEARLVDLRALIVEGERFFVATDGVYKQLLDEMAAGELHMKAADLHRSDLPRLLKGPRFERFFPREMAVPTFKHFLAGIGLDLKTVAGTDIRIDDDLNPLKEPRAACFSIRVPSDIRISVKPTGGLDDAATFFHEGGHALHYANATTDVWEFQQLGPYALTEGLAETFRFVWDDPVWLRHYRDFIAAWNREHKTSYPTMSDADIADLVRARVFSQLYFLRRYAMAKLVYESALHGGDPSLWKGIYSGQTKDLQALYKDRFARAYGFALTDEDSLRYRTDVDDLFYSADYSRAFGLANLIHEGLRNQIGTDWYTNKAAGDALRKLFKDGNRLQPDEVAVLMGFKPFDLRPTETRLTRLLDESRKK